MTDVTVRLPDELLDFLDKLVAKGGFVDRAEAIRDLIRATKEGVEKQDPSPPQIGGGDGGDVIIQMRVPDAMIP